VGDSSDERGVQAVVFALVAATFLTVYVTQPVLPILRAEFGVTPGIASLTVSAVVLGIALANLPFGVLADRFPVRPIVVAGGTVFAAAIALTFIPSLAAIAASLTAICGGFFAMHAAAVGSLNARLTESRGRANSLYVLLYYLGGATGISAAGAAYARWGWPGVTTLGLAPWSSRSPSGSLKSTTHRVGDLIDYVKLHRPTPARCILLHLAGLLGGQGVNHATSLDRSDGSRRLPARPTGRAGGRMPGCRHDDRDHLFRRWLQEPGGHLHEGRGPTRALGRSHPLQCALGDSRRHA